MQIQEQDFSLTGTLIWWSNGFLAFIVAITLFEIGVTIYKTLRYGVAVKSN